MGVTPPRASCHPRIGRPCHPRLRARLRPRSYVRNPGTARAAHCNRICAERTFRDAALRVFPLFLFPVEQCLIGRPIGIVPVGVIEAASDRASDNRAQRRAEHSRRHLRCPWPTVLPMSPPATPPITAPLGFLRPRIGRAAGKQHGWNNKNIILRIGIDENPLMFKCSRVNGRIAPTLAIACPWRDSAGIMVFLWHEAARASVHCRLGCRPLTRRKWR